MQGGRAELLQAHLYATYECSIKHGPCNPEPASRSLRRALLTTQVNSGYFYRCRASSVRDVKSSLVGYGRRKGALKSAPKTILAGPPARGGAVSGERAVFCLADSDRDESYLEARPAQTPFARVLGSWGNTTRGAVSNKERWKGRRTPTQDPSTHNTRGRARPAQTM